MTCKCYKPKTQNLAAVIFAGLLMTLAGCSDSGGGASIPSGNGSGSGNGDDDNDSDGSDEPMATPFTPGETGSTDIGQVLVNDNGMTLYVFENDRNDTDEDGAGDSDCNGECAENWPPVIASDDDTGEGPFSIITRDDGETRQWAFKGLPLYHFAGDSEPGDTEGEGLNDVWYVARPDPWTTDAVDINGESNTLFVGARDVADVDENGEKLDSRSDRTGLTLYTFEPDRGADGSNCNGDCAVNWPPLYADNGATEWGDFTIVERDDGSRQWAFNGMPLYFFVNDEEAGQTNGEGLNDAWYVARPSPWTTAEVDTDSAQGTIFVGARDVAGVDSSGGRSSTRDDREGFALYTFEFDRDDGDGDGTGDSDCNGDCAVAWPPLYAEENATPTGNFSIIERDDGTRQWAFKELPLYFYVGDEEAGETNGEGVDGFGGLWWVARPDPFQTADSSIGTVLAGATSVTDVDGSGNPADTRSERDGFTLYVFDNDAEGVSNCNGDCAVNWPPLYADNGATAWGDYTVIDRDDGSRQWAFKGEPLYFFANDSEAGDVTGDQVGDVWHTARPAPVQLFNAGGDLGDILAARGEIADVDGSGNRAGTFSDKTGYTLYWVVDDRNDTDGDGTGDSDCNGSCAVQWPPLYAEDTDTAAGDFTIIERDDGSTQWAYKGDPLYFYQGDSDPGDVTGVYGTWHEVTP